MITQPLLQIALTGTQNLQTNLQGLITTSNFTAQSKLIVFNLLLVIKCLGNTFINLIILCSSATQITSPTPTTVVKILYGYTTSYSMESYLLNMNYVDSATDILTIGGSNSAFIGCIKNFQIFIGTSTAFISIILSISISYVITSVTINFPMCPSGCQLSIRTQRSYCLTSSINSCLLPNQYYDFTMSTCRSTFLCLLLLISLWIDCDDRCTVCRNSTICTFCASGYFLNENAICDACFANCFECTGSNSNQCTSCLSGYFLNENAECNICSANCFECLGPNSNQCISCTLGTYLESYVTPTNCVTNCTDGFYANNVSAFCQRIINLS